MPFLRIQFYPLPPAYRNWERTLAWAFWISSLTVLPLLKIHRKRGSAISFLQEVLSQDSYRYGVTVPIMVRKVPCSLWPSIALLFGNWAACIVIPLDWDRPWQKWPIPNVFLGSILFFLVSGLSPAILYLQSASVKESRSTRKSPQRAMRSKSPRRSESSPRTASPKRSKSPNRSSPRRSPRRPRTLKD